MSNRISKDFRGRKDRYLSSKADIVFNNLSDKTVVIVFAQTAESLTTAKSAKASARAGAGAPGVLAELGLELEASSTKRTMEREPFSCPLPPNGGSCSYTGQRGVDYYLTVLSERSRGGYRVHVKNNVINATRVEAYNISPDKVNESLGTIEGIEDATGRKERSERKSKSSSSRRKEPRKKSSSGPDTRDTQGHGSLGTSNHATGSKERSERKSSSKKSSSSRSREALRKKSSSSNSSTKKSSGAGLKKKSSSNPYSACPS